MVNAAKKKSNLKSHCCISCCIHGGQSSNIICSNEQVRMQKNVQILNSSVILSPKLQVYKHINFKQFSVMLVYAELVRTVGK